MIKKITDTEKTGKWTVFYDMHSGGGLKEPPHSIIVIEGDGPTAKGIFMSQFGHDPEDVACHCCGSNYDIAEYDSFDEVARYYLGESSLEEFTQRPDVLILHR